ncbi:DUF2065 domain-containing protein [Falsiroseomonas oryziterrae]|uniref:DUF2065 domain-containing protein n=1 Tax=Falsiroseomonas oryziterrae TaxID=2911368 RepID=UPI001F1D6239|nr:DUF2065 domain-containing protein [Roseomonas sp. NPKOSM-4]
MGLEQLLAGVAVVLALEGLLYATAPGAMRRALGELLAQPDDRLRIGGLAAAALGIGAAWLLIG